MAAGAVAMEGQSLLRDEGLRPHGQRQERRISIHPGSEIGSEEYALHTLASGLGKSQSMMFTVVELPVEHGNGETRAIDDGGEVVRWRFLTEAGRPIGEDVVTWEWMSPDRIQARVRPSHRDITQAWHHIWVHCEVAEVAPASPAHRNTVDLVWAVGGPGSPLHFSTYAWQVIMQVVDPLTREGAPPSTWEEWQPVATLGTVSAFTQPSLQVVQPDVADPARAGNGAAADRESLLLKQRSAKVALGALSWSETGRANVRGIHGRITADLRAQMIPMGGMDIEVRAAPGRFAAGGRPLLGAAPEAIADLGTLPFGRLTLSFSPIAKLLQRAVGTSAAPEAGNQVLGAGAAVGMEVGIQRASGGDDAKKRIAVSAHATPRIARESRMRRTVIAQADAADFAAEATVFIVGGFGQTDTGAMAAMNCLIHARTIIGQGRGQESGRPDAWAYLTREGGAQVGPVEMCSAMLVTNVKFEKP